MSEPYVVKNLTVVDVREEYERRIPNASEPSGYESAPGYRGRATINGHPCQVWRRVIHIGPWVRVDVPQPEQVAADA